MQEPEQMELPETEGEINLTISLSDRETKNEAKVSVNIFSSEREVVRKHATAALNNALERLGL